MADVWYRDRYFITFLGMMIVVVVTVMSNPFILTMEVEKILNRINSEQNSTSKELINSENNIQGNLTAHRQVTNFTRDTVVENQKEIKSGIANITALINHTHPTN